MTVLEPTSDTALAQCLLDAANTGSSVRLGDAPGVETADIAINTRGLSCILQYEPRDLTISVEAGVKFGELSSRLASDGLMLPLDPPWAPEATIGGLVAANLNGPRRRLYGTARDHVIGMRFATLEGTIVETGGMVVKNVAGLDMAKLLIGSFGTLAAIVSVNFKLTPLPKQSRTLLFDCATAKQAFQLRDRVLKSILPVASLDILNPQAAARCGVAGSQWVVALRAVAAVERYGTEFPGGRDVDCDSFWEPVREFTPRYLAEHPAAVVTRFSTTHQEMPALAEALSTSGSVVARAGSGILRSYTETAPATPAQTIRVVEHAPPGVERWPDPGEDLAWMQRIKQMFDPKGLLNRGALYGRI